MKNAYARKLIAAQAAAVMAQRDLIISKTVEIMMRISAVAMNRVLGVGPDRLVKVQESMKQLFDEYAEMQKTDQDYADGKLEETYNSIFAKEKEP